MIPRLLHSGRGPLEPTNPGEYEGSRRLSGTPPPAPPSPCLIQSPMGGSPVNAAFLLVMTACSAGADPVQAPPPAAKPGAPAPIVAPAPAGYNDCGGGDCGCGHEGFFSKFKG